MFNLQLLVVISIWETVFTMAVDLEITRNGWKKGDSIKILSSSCDKGFNCTRLKILSSSCDKGFNCTRLNAEEKGNSSDCSCICPNKSSTFILYKKTWGCQENEKVCTLLGGDKKTPVYLKKLHMLKVVHKGKVKLDKDSGRNCSLNAQSFSYFRCDGTPKVIRAGKLSQKDNDSLLLEVINTTSFDSITGGIIKVTINCKKGENTKSFVLLFKYEGSFNCTKVAQGSSSTSQVPSTTPFTSSVVTDLSRTPSSTLAKRPTTSDSPSKDPVVARRDPGHERGTEGKSSPVALIAGVTVAILVILIIIAVLVYRHRHSGDNSNSGKESKEKRKTAMSSLDGITLNTLGNEDHYKALTLREPAVYESVRDGEAHIGNSRKSDHNEEHIYAPLNISEGENINGHRNNKEIVIQDTMPKINGPISVHHRVYDLMEELVMDPLKGPVENGENGSEPVYNVLEGSCLDGPQSPAYFGITSDSTDGLHYDYIDKGNHPMSNVSEQKESSFYAATGVTEPVYNTLEAPVTENDGDPVYDVLEAPEDA